VIETRKIQKELFRKIRRSIPDHLSLAEEISEKLGISTDSAYRRIRGEKLLTIEELYKLSYRYNISVDSLFNATSQV
jgi:transcriptional regulator with XRE-family HTH domain